jgi:Arc/MetJ family transcription regulator
VAKTSVDIDPARLAAVREILGTETLRDTIDAAFQQVIRTRAVQGLFDLAREGAFSALLEPDIEDQLWG